MLGRGWGKINKRGVQGGVLTPYDDKDSMKVLANYPDMVSVDHYSKKLMKNMN